ncbi:MAG: DUF3800 domain-containing protein [Thaumarchaeota archaeon]|nr:DUF3800 domain-containing protein [Nitrososphaerota archaeon]
MDYCTLYMDSSGDQGWPNPFGRSETIWYTVGGIVLTPEQDLAIKTETTEILKKFIEDDMRSNFPSSYYELHYLDLMCGNNIYNKLEKIDRRKMADEVFALIKEIKPIVIATSINKLQMRKVYEDNAKHPKTLAVGSVISKFSMHLTRNNKIGTVVYDEEEYRNDVLMRRMVSSFRRVGTEIKGWNYLPRKTDKLTNVLNTINLCPSELSPGIQLADFIARSVWQHYEKQKNRRYEELNSLWDFDEKKQIYYRDSVVPSIIKWK